MRCCTGQFADLKCLDDLNPQVTSFSDGNPSSPDHVHEEYIPSRPRTRSQTKRMALMLDEEGGGTNGFTGVKVPGFVHSIS